MCNNPNRRVQISCIIAHFETRLNRLLKQAADNVVFMKNGSNKLFCIDVLETKREKYFQNLSYFPYFNIDVQPELVNGNFNDEKESLMSRRRNDEAIQIKKRNLS